MNKFEREKEKNFGRALLSSVSSRVPSHDLSVQLSKPPYIYRFMLKQILPFRHLFGKECRNKMNINS